jgi:uncharacterized repeat protein (TIGR02543 family)
VSVKKLEFMRRAALCAALIAVLASCQMAGITVDTQDASGTAEDAKCLTGPQATNSNKLLVTFDPRGGTVDPATKLVKKGSEYGELPVPGNPGYAFGGWRTEADGRGSLITASTKVTAKADQTLYAVWNQSPRKVYGTAAIGASAFFFEFSAETGKEASVLLPLYQSGYVQNGKVQYRKIDYTMAWFYYDPSTGQMAGATGANRGVSYAFQGLYSPTQGFFGYITKTDKGVASQGLLGGTPMFAGMDVSNYVGAATYLFETPTPQTLLFSATINADSGEVIGNWCESGEGWGYSIHGSLGGVADKKVVNISALPLPEFEQYLLYPMSASGVARFKDASRRDISGTFDILYGGMLLPSLLTATREGL